MKRTHVIAITLATVLTATAAHAARPDDLQAPRGQDDLQAPRGQDLQAPRR